MCIVYSIVATPPITLIEDTLYSVQVYQTAIGRDIIAVLGFSLCQPVYRSVSVSHEQIAAL